MRTLNWLVLATIVGGCSNNGPSMKDAAVADMAVNVDLQTPGDMTMPPVLSGTKLASGFSLQLLGVSNDDTVFLSSAAMNKGAAALSALPAQGGTALMIQPSWTNSVLFPNGALV